MDKKHFLRDFQNIYGKIYFRDGKYIFLVMRSGMF